MKYVSAILLILTSFAFAGDAPAQERGHFYRIERDRSGVWWFRNPNGARFLSLGVADIPSGASRERYDPANPAYAAFRYYDSTEAWATDVRDNLQRWGFNTIGAWGHPLLKADGFPETASLHWGKELGAPWCDVFADEFQQRIEEFAVRDVAPRKDDPRLLGWFSDNELAWYADTIFWFHLHNDKPTVTRRKLIATLRDHYGNDFKALQVDFHPGSATTFDELGQSGPVYLQPDGKGYAAINRFVFLVAEHYYRTVHNAIRRHDRCHLILGDRYMSYCPPVVAKAAGPYVDVISTNFDWPDWTLGELPTNYLRMLHHQSGRPVLVTEWYVAARENRSGNRNTGENFTKVNTQAQRARTAERRIETLVSQPYVVGIHWFRYADQPTNGRAGDREDFNFGLVDIHNRPYEKLVAAMQRANQRATDLHTDAAAREDCYTPVAAYHAGPVQFPASVEQFTPLATDDPLPLAELRVGWDEKHIYVGIVGFQFVDQRLFEGEAIPPAIRGKLKLKLGDASFDLRVEPGNAADWEAGQAVEETRHRHRGVRFTYLAAVPSGSIAGIDRLQAGTSVPLEVRLVDPMEGSTTWKAELLLTGGPEQETDR